MDAAVTQNLRAYAVRAQVHAAALRCVAGFGRAFKLGQQLRAAFAAIQQHHHAPALGSHELQALVQAPGVHGAADFERVKHRQRLVHARGHGLACGPLAFDQRQVHTLAGLVFESVRSEFTKRCLQGAGADFFNQRFVPAAVFDQIGNGANLQAMRLCKDQQVGQACHGAVVVHDLADHRGRRTSGHGRQVATGFGVAGAHQHAAVHRLQREDMAGLHQVVDLGVFGHGRLHRAGAVGG